MTFTDDFLTGICETIAAYPGKHMPYEYKTGTDVYSADACALAWEVEPDLDRTIMVRTYPVADDVAGSDDVIGVQFQISGPDDMAFINAAIDDLFDLFQSRRSGTLGTVKVVQVERRSGAFLGQDGRGRVSRTENYYFTVHRPSTTRTY